ncbi:hypothetical protein [Nocardia sp. NPDC056100]|uniref:hypothetical protein n=1 Tax=Nocardia sp. NPDC056100 TaxID=3345712 RepID=UPI0035DBC0C8
MFGYIFDTTMLVSLGRGDHGPAALLASLHDRDIRVCVPVLTLSYAFTELPAEQHGELLGIIVAMSNTAVEPLTDAVDALELADILARIPDSPAAAHVLAAARKQDMEIVTLDTARWRDLEQQLQCRIPLVELTDEP